MIVISNFDSSLLCHLLGFSQHILEFLSITGGIAQIMFASIVDVKHDGRIDPVDLGLFVLIIH